jgi:hypothetical protein
VDEAKRAMEATADLVHRRVLPAGYGPRRFPQLVWPYLGGFGCRVISTAQLGKVKEKTACSELGDWVLASFRWPETGVEPPPPAFSGPLPMDLSGLESADAIDTKDVRAAPI